VGRAGVVHDDLDVREALGRRGDLRGVGDVERDRVQPRVGDRRDVADAGVDARRPAVQQLLGDRPPDAPVGARDERDARRRQLAVASMSRTRSR
jgi:hypothetical protein